MSDYFLRKTDFLPRPSVTMKRLEGRGQLSVSLHRAGVEPSFTYPGGSRTLTLLPPVPCVGPRDPTDTPFRKV
ncbi:hypothetical protein AAFF_G00205890 [Aldrovandia affinis]|uniref:Uncharacterized protein n=1 Tax=Aldrovandia affinis TaxID=143900 RepID=A0AAD7RKA9_9TELE|nr:hypothetical protein AAFF_G00205890 [Aldrovandia affinis]